MLDYAAETQVEYLERNIAEVRGQLRHLENKPFGERIDAEASKLRVLAGKMTAELHDLRPYKVVSHGSNFIVAHRGDYIVDGNDWLIFETQASAYRWISGQGGLAA